MDRWSLKLNPLRMHVRPSLCEVLVAAEHTLIVIHFSHRSQRAAFDSPPFDQYWDHKPWEQFIHGQHFVSSGYNYDDVNHDYTGILESPHFILSPLGRIKLLLRGGKHNIELDPENLPCSYDGADEDKSLDAWRLNQGGTVVQAEYLDNGKWHRIETKTGKIRWGMNYMTDCPGPFGDMQGIYQEFNEGTGFWKNCWLCEPGTYNDKAEVKAGCTTCDLLGYGVTNCYDTWGDPSTGCRSCDACGEGLVSSMMPNGGRVCVPDDDSGRLKQVSWASAWLKAPEYGDANDFSRINSKLSDSDINKLNFRYVVFTPDDMDNLHPETVFDLTGTSWDSEAARPCTTYAFTIDEMKHSEKRKNVWATRYCQYEVCNFGRAHFPGNIWSSYGYRNGGGCGSGPITASGVYPWAGSAKMYVYDETPKLANPNAYSVFREIEFTPNMMKDVSAGKEMRIRVYDLWKGIDGAIDIDFVRIIGCIEGTCSTDLSNLYQSEVNQDNWEERAG